MEVESSEAVDLNVGTADASSVEVNTGPAEVDTQSENTVK